MKPSDFTQINTYKNNINICFTTNNRKDINNIKMNELYKKNKCRTGLKLDALPYDERSQDVILNKGMPIICRINNEEMKLINNQRFKIIKLGVFTITIEDDKGGGMDINHNEYQNYFLVAYATTIHSSQGMSIDAPYTIQQWDRLDQRLLYVALSRSRNHSYIHFMD